MRKLLSISLLGSAMALSACATSPYGSQYGGYGSPYGAYGGVGGPLEAIIGAIGAAGNSGYYGNPGYGNNFQQAAVNACASVAARYGQVQIRDVRMSSRDTLRVYGIAGSAYGARDFGCSFRSDGRITDFDI